MTQALPANIQPFLLIDMAATSRSTATITKNNNNIQTGRFLEILVVALVFLLRLNISHPPVLPASGSNDSSKWPPFVCPKYFLC
jgi:hypothetical protein